MSQRPNFYELLELEPREDNWEVIEKQIVSKRKAWSKAANMGSPNSRSIAKRNLSFLSQITTLMKDPAARKKEAQHFLKGYRREAESHLQEWIEIYAVKKLCTEAQLKELIQQFEESFTLEEISNRLEQAGVTLSRLAKRSRKSRETLDPVAANAVRNFWAFLKITIFGVLTWSLVIGLALLVANVVSSTFIKYLLIAGFCLPFYYWTTGFVFGLLALRQNWKPIEAAS